MCSSSSKTVRASLGLSSVCQIAVTSVRMASSAAASSDGVSAGFCMSTSRRTMAWCLRRIVRRVGAVGCALNTGTIRSEASRRCDRREVQARVAQPEDGFLGAARLADGRGLQVVPPAADAVHLLGRVDDLEIGRERAHEIPRAPRC